MGTTSSPVSENVPVPEKSMQLPRVRGGVADAVRVQQKLIGRATAGSGGGGVMVDALGRPLSPTTTTRGRTMSPPER